MRKQLNGKLTKRRSKISFFAIIVLLVSMLGAHPVTANNHGQPTTAKAGIAFPGNDWIAFPDGGQYLAKLGNPSPQLLSQLAALRQRHLQAVANLVDAIEKGKVDLYLNNQFRCPTH